MAEDAPTAENPKVTPEEAEAKVATAVSEVLPEDSTDSLLVEEDGDSFWLIQRIFWGILKTALLLGLLVLLIWLVWQPKAFFNKTAEPSFTVDYNTTVEPSLAEVPAEPKPQARRFWQRWFSPSPDLAEEVVPDPAPVQNLAEPTVSTPPPQPRVSTQDPTGAETAYALEDDRVRLVRGILPDSVSWLRRAKNIGEFSLVMLREATPDVRSRHIETVLAEADQLFVESANLQVQLRAELDYFLQKGEAANLNTQALENKIATSLQKLDPVELEGLVQQKIVSQQAASYFLSNAKIRDTLLRNIQTFDALLRQRSIPLLNPATELRAS